jgi:hypothetical protein
MSVITVWKSDADGKLFEDKTKYQKHLRKLARERLVRRKLEIVEAKTDLVWAELYEREQSIEQWRDMIIAEQDLFWAEAARVDEYDWRIVGKKRKGVVCPVPRLLEFDEFRLHWSDEVSNGHSCPVGGVTNWGGRDESAPRGYPGWHGRLSWVYAWPKEWDGHYLGGDLFGGFGNQGRARAHTGSGGSGGTVYSKKHNCFVTRCGYSFEIFAADWPGLARYREKQLVWKELGGKTSKELMNAMS